MKAILLVGGEGTRLRPLSYDVPKPLMPIAEVPYVEQVALFLKKHGVNELILSACYLSEQIQTFCESAEVPGMKFTYAVEPSPLGTGGAIGYAAQGLTETFLVLNGDILTDFDLHRNFLFHREKQALATLALVPVEDPSRFGVVELDGENHILRFIEKPKREDAPTPFINAGMYIMEPEVLDYIPLGKPVSVERDVFPQLAAMERLFGVVQDPYWLDMGTPENYLQIHSDFLLGRISLASKTVFLNGNWYGENIKLSPKAKIISPVYIGDGCRIEEGAAVGPFAVLGKSSTIASGAHVEGSVLWENVTVGKCAVVSKTIVGKNVNIQEGVRLHREVIRSENKIHAKGC